MLANKLIYDLYSTSGGTMPYEEYKKWYDSNDIVYVMLMDSKIYTKVKRSILFDKNMHHGCFIECRSYSTPKDVEKNAMKVVNDYNLRYVNSSEFIAIENESEEKRIKEALKIAEHMIASN